MNLAIYQGLMHILDVLDDGFCTINQSLELGYYNFVHPLWFIYPSCLNWRKYGGCLQKFCNILNFVFLILLSLFLFKCFVINHAVQAMIHRRLNNVIAWLNWWLDQVQNFYSLDNWSLFAIKTLKYLNWKLKINIKFKENQNF